MIAFDHDLIDLLGTQRMSDDGPDFLINDAVRAHEGSPCPLTVLKGLRHLIRLRPSLISMRFEVWACQSLSKQQR